MTGARTATKCATTNKNSMAIVEQIMCDMCGTVLVGSKGIHKISKSYVEIAGFVRDWTADPQSGWREYAYVSAPDKRQMAFCTEDDAQCFFDYLDMKRKQNKVHREAKLREEASVDWEIRNAPPRPSGGTGPNGSWKPEGPNGYTGGASSSGYKKMGSPPPAGPPPAY